MNSTKLYKPTVKNGDYLFDPTITFDRPVEIHFVRIEEFDDPDAYKVLILSSESYLSPNRETNVSVIKNKDLYDLIPFKEKEKIKFLHIKELNEKYNVENKNKYDMAFIDGNHSNYNIIMNDFINSNNIVKDDGIIVFDDYGNFPVVTKVVNDIMKKHKEYEYLYVPFRGYLFMPDKKDEKSGEVILFKNPQDISKIYK